MVQGWHAVAERALENGLPHLAEQIWKLIGGIAGTANRRRAFASQSGASEYLPSRLTKERAR